jgi:GNAT superfamily N-acetyltransferase
MCRVTMRPPDRGTLPAGYPVTFERQVRLRDGRSVLVRPILPSDAAALGAAIRDSDPDTLRRRFLGTPPRFTPALLSRLTTVDYVRRFALVAFDPATEQGVAVARYEPLPDATAATAATAEIAVAVVPGWRRGGLATALVVLLAEAAIDRGVRFFGASYLAGNRPIEAMLAHTRTGARHLLAQGVAELAITLDNERPS